MTITKRLRTEFPGITAMIAGFANALRACHAYNRAVEDMDALNKKDPVNAWIWDVTQHSTLSYSDALSIYTYLSKYSTAFTQLPKEITEFVIEMAGCGHTADVIIRYLMLVDVELDIWAREKLSMHQ